ncbi:MAG: DUF924 family protein [Granulosicoccus sp.]
MSQDKDQHHIRRVLTAWFEDKESGRMDLPQSRRWFNGGKAFDTQLAESFGQVLEDANGGKLDHWQESANGALALVIVLDQFNRNIYRKTAKAFAHDPLALKVSEHALQKGFDQQIPTVQRIFLYLPFEHCESRAAQERSVALFSALFEQANEPQAEFTQRALDSAIEHQQIIERFGRYPYRNAVLGRTSTVDEMQWLAEQQSRFGQ